MALIKCKECGKEISEKATQCVNCGCPTKEIKSISKDKDESKVSNVLIWFVALLPVLSTILLWIILAISNSWVIAIIVIIIMNVGSIYLLLKDYKSLNDNKINTEILGKISTFKIVIPKYLYNRTKLMGHKLGYFITWVVGFVVFAIVIILGVNPLPLLNNSINFVKDGSLYSCPGYTVQELVDNYMENPKWETGTTNEGIKAVNIKGNITYDDKPAKALIQFFINGDEFDFNAFELDGIPQSSYLFLELADDMCRNMENEKSNSTDNDNNVSAEKYIHEIDINQFKNKLNGNFKNVVYLGTNSCQWCFKYESELEKILPQLKLNIYYVNATMLDPKLFEPLAELSITGYPLTVIVKNGKVLDYLEGYVKADRILDFFGENALYSKGDKE